MKTELVSVIIPFYKGKDWLTEALESVLKQTYKKIEIIVINDGSEEDISEIINKYNKEVKFYFQTNQGAAVARNLGIRNSNGKFIAFLDSDDIWTKNKLEVQIALMKKHNSYWSHTNYLKFGLNEEEEVNIKNFQGNVFPLSLISNPIATPSVVIRKSVFIDNPDIKFEETMKFGEDTILWLQLSLKYDLLAINENLVKVRIRGSNSSLRAYSQLQARGKIWSVIILNELFNYSRDLSLLTKLAYKYCYFTVNLFSSYDKHLNPHIKEFISKILYVYPWFSFKLEKKLLSFSNKKNGRIPR